jgi:hypothetical protein
MSRYVGKWGNFAVAKVDEVHGKPVFDADPSVE